MARATARFEELTSNILPFPGPKAVIENVDNLSFMRSLPKESMQLIVTSPPYNLGKEYEKRRSHELYIEEQAAAIAEAVRLLHPKGSICWQVGNHIDDGEVFPLDILLYPLFRNHGLKLRNRIVWAFGHGLHCQKRFSGRHETILWFTKDDDHIFNLDPVRVPSKYPEKKHFKGPRRGEISGNPLGKNPSDVWDIPNVKANHVEKTDHPCQFPVGLVERLVLALTNRGDSVLDPYLGVGSSAVAAVKNGRNAYGCDVMAEYVEIAQERVADLQAGEVADATDEQAGVRAGSQGGRMRLAWVANHNNGQIEWESRELFDWLTDVFQVPSLQLKPGVTQDIRQHVRSEFEREGWSINVRVDPDYDLTVFAVRDDLAVQLQTGNMSRAPYDLLKLQYLHTTDRIKAAALALPTKQGAAALGSNIAHADRVASELQLFKHIINIPILVVAFD